MIDELETYLLENKDCLQALKKLPENSIATCITDPPYHLTSGSGKRGFMNKEWDGGGTSFQKETWQEVYRVLKPGAMCVVFGGERTFHRIAVAIEDAGFEIKNILAYVYGSGHPRGLNIGKAVDKILGNERDIVDGELNPEYYNSPDTVKPRTVGFTEWEGYYSALKPAYEPIIVAMKPLDGTYAENALKWGVAGYNVDRSRIAHNEEQKQTVRQPLNGAVFNAKTAGYKKAGVGYATPDPKGRFPATFIHDGSDDVLDLLPDSKSTFNIRKNNKAWGTQHTYGKSKTSVISGGYDDEGSVARFFYCAKASKKERMLGLDGTGIENTHPTLKPLELMRYLARITRTPNGGIVLDPFMGSGTTGIACAIEGRKFIGIELEKEYFEIAKARVRYAYDSEEFIKGQKIKE